MKLGASGGKTSQERTLTEVPFYGDKAGDVIHHVEEISREHEDRSGGGVVSDCFQLVDDISVVQKIDECSVILGVPTNTDVYLPSPTGEGGHEVEEGNLDETRVFSN